MESPKPQHYRSLFNWILGYKPLDGGQYEFLFHHDDFVSSIKSNHDSRFDEIIEWMLSRWPNSKLFQVQVIAPNLFKSVFMHSLESLKQFETDIKQTILGNRPETRSVPNGGIYTFSRTKAAIVAIIMALIVAFTVLIIPVILLYLTQMSNGARAGMVLVFVPTFAILMSLFLMARVEAVFIGTCT